MKTLRQRVALEGALLTLAELCNVASSNTSMIDLVIRSDRTGRNPQASWNQWSNGAEIPVTSDTERVEPVRTSLVTLIAKPNLVQLLVDTELPA